MNSIVFVTCFFCYLVSGVHGELLFWSESPNVPKDSEFVFGCFASDAHKDEPLSVGREVYTGTQNVGQGFTVNNDIESTNQTLPDDSGFPPGSVISYLKNDNFELYKIYMPKGQAGRVGAFYCNNLRTELKIVTLVNPSESEADLIPSYYHKTVKTGNQVDLVVTLNSDNTADTIWRHNDDNIKDWKGYREVQIRDVTEDDGGIYESYLKGERETGRQSIVLLNVRGCTDGKWGENCERDCPRCYNGGMCNDEDGTCICPPGFIGELCENACPRHFFGANCEIPCSMTTGRDNTCNGQFICQREPYGCSCVAGYGGKNCTEDCQEGYYGAGCTQYCNFCTSSKCDPITGGCYEGCNEGRTEPQCIDLPEFTTEPDVAETTSERVKLAWGSLEEVSNFPVTGYIVWFKQSSSSDWKRKPRDGVLESSSSATVKNLEPDTEYKFYIEAKISHPYVVSEIKSETITVKTKCGRPSIAPHAITVTQSGPNNLKVEWQVQEDISENVLKCNEDKSKFLILYGAEGTQPSSIATSSLSNRMHIIGNNSLTPCTQYTVMVFLFNGEKEGPRSQPAIGQTGLPTSPSPVTNLKVYQHSLPTALLAEWTSSRECKEYVYIVRYKSITIDDCECSSCEYLEPEYTLKGFTGNYTINGLIPYSIYKVEVFTAVDDAGSEKSSSARTYGRTSQSAPSGPPENVTKKTMSSTSVGFKWDGPACGMKNGEITGYNAMMTPPVGDAIEKHSSGKETQFDNLMPYTKYGFQVQAVNDKGTGNFSQPLMVTTLEDKPGKPKMLRVKETTNTSMTLKWEIPERPNGIITAYTILWLPLKENVSKITVDIQDKMVYKVKNLESFTEYSFCVKAETSAGTGVCSTIVTDKAMAGVPSEPVDVQIVNKGQQFIDIKWDVPKQTNGHITIYQVHIMLIDRPYEKNFNQHKYYLDYKENVTTLQHKFSSLSPATEYRILIQAFTILPGVASDPIDVVTKVKVPKISEMPPPIIVEQMSGTTLEVQLQQVVSKNAPISAYKLVVRHQDDGPKNKRDTSNDLFNGNGWQLFEYYTAKAQGLSYYVTAEFSGSETLPETFIVGDGEVIGGYYNAPLMSGVNYQLHFGILSTTEEETFFVMSNGSTISTIFTVENGDISPVIGAIIAGIVFALLVGLVMAIFIVKYHRNINGGKGDGQRPLRVRSRTSQIYELETLEPMVARVENPIGENIVNEPEVYDVQDDALHEDNCDVLDIHSVGSNSLINLSNNSGTTGDSMDSISNNQHQESNWECRYENQQALWEFTDIWEFPPERLEICTANSLLGSGEFGEVRRAVAVDINGWRGRTEVAVKSMKGHASKEEKEEFLNELILMKSISTNHPNVVSLLGCVTKSEPLCIIVELAPGGSLLDYLRKNHSDHIYTNLHADSRDITERDLLSFGWQVSKGMSYLENIKCLHRDLAARNILLWENKTCKISDFGLARDVKGVDMYKRKTDRRLPLRWMAPESIHYEFHTCKSDVWSYGVVLWEIVTLGATPYAALSSKQMCDSLLKGRVLDKPPHCNDALYQVMCDCWKITPNTRPTFSKLCSTMENIVADTMKEYLTMSDFESHLYSNIPQNECPPGEIL